MFLWGLEEEKQQQNKTTTTKMRKLKGIYCLFSHGLNLPTNMGECGK